MGDFLVRSVAINVGVNTRPKWGGFRAPIFSDGSFEFIHIPWKDKYGKIEPKPKKYNEMRYSSYVPDNLKNEFVLVSPDFDNRTYASTMGAPANKPILSLNQNDYLFFYATLRFKDEKGKREDWVNPNWGAYLVGLFKIAFIYAGLAEVLSDKNAKEAFKEYAWFKSLLKRRIYDDGITPWIKGVVGESGLLGKAIPLGDADPNNPQKWSDQACKLFRTSRGKELEARKKAIFQTVLTCEGECLDKLLANCILRSSLDVG